MTKEGFARLAFEAYHDASHPEGGGWAARTALTPGQAACEAAGEDWATQGRERRARWEAVAQAAREHRGPLPPDMLTPEWAFTPEETAYKAFTARQGYGRRISWAVLSHEEHADWRAVVRALENRAKLLARYAGEDNGQ